MKISPNLLAIKVPFQLPLPDGKMLERFVWSYVYAGTVVIDSGVRGFSKLLERALEENFPESAGPEWMLFTHAHPDHIGGARCVLHSWPTCRTAAPAEAAAWIENPALQFEQRPVPGFHEIVGGKVKVSRLLCDGDFISCPAGRVRAIAADGHCTGQLAYLIESERALIAGDAVPAYGQMPIYEDVTKTRETLARLLGIVSGTDVFLSSWDSEPVRGPEAARRRLESGLEWVERVHEAVRAQSKSGPVEAGDIAPAVAAELGLPAFAVNALFARAIDAHLNLLMHENEGRED